MPNELATIAPLQPVEPQDDAALIALFLQLHALKSRNTVANYRLDLKDWHNTVGCLTPLRDVTPAHLQTYHHWLQRKGYSDATIRRKLMSLGSLLKFAKESGYSERNPFTLYCKFVPPSENRIAERLLPEAKIWEIIDTEPKRARRLFLKFLYLTGVRISEALSFRLPDIVEYPRGKGYLWTFYRKGHKKGECGIPQELGDELKALGRVRPFPWERSWASDIVKRAGKRCGVPKLSPHWFRHCCATYILAKGGTKDEAQWQLGHSTSKTTDLYLHVIPGRLPSDLLTRKKRDDPA